MRTESYLVGGRDRIEPVKSLQGLQVKVRSLRASVMLRSLGAL